MSTLTLAVPTQPAFAQPSLPPPVHPKVLWQFMPAPGSKHAMMTYYPFAQAAISTTTTTQTPRQLMPAQNLQPAMLPRQLRQVPGSAWPNAPSLPPAWPAGTPAAAPLPPHEIGFGCPEFGCFEFGCFRHRPQPVPLVPLVKRPPEVRRPLPLCPRCAPVPAIQKEPVAVRVARFARSASITCFARWLMAGILAGAGSRTGEESNANRIQFQPALAHNTHVLSTTITNPHTGLHKHGAYTCSASANPEAPNHFKCRQY